jgi:biopolymer transport protein ExbD
MSLLNKKNKLKISDSLEGDCDIDITPMMNVLIILLPFLISMAVFTKIAMLSFTLPPNAGTGLSKSDGKPKLKMTIVVASHYYALTYGDKMLDSIPLTDTENDFAILKARLTSQKDAVDINNEAIVAIRDNVQFQNIVRVMDICRESGFDKIGVSSATENAENGV